MGDSHNSTAFSFTALVLQTPAEGEFEDLSKHQLAGVMEFKRNAQGYGSTKNYSGPVQYRHWLRCQRRSQLASKLKASGRRARRRGPWTGGAL